MLTGSLELAETLKKLPGCEGGWVYGHSLHTTHTFVRTGSLL
jgi:hypothetical protein